MSLLRGASAKRLQSFEADAEPAICAPFHMAQMHHLIDDQDESLGNAVRAFDFEASTAIGDTADNAIDSICAVK
jgi:hypothetical protein